MKSMEVILILSLQSVSRHERNHLVKYIKIYKIFSHQRVFCAFICI